MLEVQGAPTSVPALALAGDSQPLSPELGKTWRPWFQSRTCGSLYLGSRRHFPGRAHPLPTPQQCTGAYPTPGARRASPRIPLSALLRAPSLVRGPLPASELVLGPAWRLLQTPGLSVRLRAIGGAETRAQREPLSPRPGCQPGARAPAPTRDTHLQAALEPAGGWAVLGGVAAWATTRLLPGNPNHSGRRPSPHCAPLGAQRLGAA